MSTKTLLILAVGSVIASCAPQDTESSSAHAMSLEGALLPGSPDVVGLLALLNDSGTTFEVLDIDARLDRRAAKGLIASRDGPDDVRYTSDDQAFQTVEQVDAVKWVGPAALSSLVAYATTVGFVPQDGDILGVFDDVAFTAAEATATLNLVNTANHHTLDVEAALDRRAADGIFAARPVMTLELLADIKWVGRSAMLKLREFAKVEEPPVEEPPVAAGLPAGADCKTKAECADKMACLGIPFDSSIDKGKCAPTAKKYPGEHADCGHYQPCQGDLVCIGTTLWGEGECGATYLAGKFINDGFYAIPDHENPWSCGNNCPGVSTSVVVYGLASVPVDITVKVHIDHSKNTDLRVTLTDPNGTSSLLWENSDEVGDGLSQSFALNGISRDDNVNGEWTLRVEDTKSGGGGYLKGWSLFLTSRFD